LRGVHTGTAQTRVDLRLGWQTPDQRFGAAVLVNNAFNKHFTLGTSYAGVTAPRFVGVELNARL
jgi:iron complex outermembrane receptor protein